MACANPDTCVGRDGLRYCESCAQEALLADGCEDRHEARAARDLGAEYAHGDGCEALRQRREWEATQRRNTER